MASESAIMSVGGKDYTPSSSTMFMVQLTPDNYHMWKMEMVDYLECQRVAQPIILKGQKPGGTKMEEWDGNDPIYLRLIRRFVDDSVHHHIFEEKTTYSAWMTLRETFRKPSLASKVLTLRKFVYMNYVDGTPMATHPYSAWMTLKETFWKPLPGIAQKLDYRLKAKDESN